MIAPQYIPAESEESSVKEIGKAVSKFLELLNAKLRQLSNRTAHAASNKTRLVEGSREDILVILRAISHHAAALFEHKDVLSRQLSGHTDDGIKFFFPIFQQSDACVYMLLTGEGKWYWLVEGGSRKEPDMTLMFSPENPDELVLPWEERSIKEILKAIISTIERLGKMEKESNLVAMLEETNKTLRDCRQGLLNSVNQACDALEVKDG
jgi:hypothetical protein